jgi:hypothetical protein
VLYIINDLGNTNTSESVTKLIIKLDEYTSRNRNLLKETNSPVIDLITNPYLAL